MNYWTERIVFDVVKLPLPFNGILGRPTLAKFMAASHYTYNTLKMPGPIGVISIPPEKKDAVICVDKMYRDAVAADAVVALAPAKEGKKSKKTSQDTDKVPGKRACSECITPDSDLPESSTSKKLEAAPPATKKVLARQAGTDGTFTISSTLDDR